MTGEIAPMRAHALLVSVGRSIFSLSCELSLLFKSLLVNLSLVLIHFLSVGQLLSLLPYVLFSDLLLFLVGLLD